MNVIDNINVQNQEYSLRGIVSKVPFVFIAMDPDSDSAYYIAVPEIFKDVISSLMNDENVSEFTVTFSDSLFPICVGTHILEPLTDQNVPNKLWYLNMFTLIPYLANCETDEGAVDQYMLNFPGQFSGLISGFLSHYKASGSVRVVLQANREE